MVWSPVTGFIGARTEVFSVMGIVGFIVSYLGTVLVSMFVTIYNKKSVTAMVPSLILFTLFMLTWVPINIVSIFKKNVNWKHIGHDKSISIEDIVKTS